MHRFPMVLTLVVVSLGCSSSDSSSGPKGTPATNQACVDTAVAVAKAEERCGQPYQASYDAFVGAVGGCGNVVQIRDEASLRATCLPSLGTISCADLMAGSLDPTCLGQLLKPKSLGGTPPSATHVQSFSAPLED